MSAQEITPKGFVSAKASAKKEIRTLLGFDIAGAKRDPNPGPGDRSILGQPSRQGWRLTLAGSGWAIYLNSSDDIRDPRLMNVWRVAASRQLGNVDSPLPLLSRAQARRVLVLMHVLAEAS
jgi:hypothetical protein